MSQLIHLIDGGLHLVELVSPRGFPLDYDQYLRRLEEDPINAELAATAVLHSVQATIHPQYINLGTGFRQSTPTNYSIFENLVAKAQREAEKAGVPFFGLRVVVEPKKQPSLPLDPFEAEIVFSEKKSDIFNKKGLEDSYDPKRELIRDLKPKDLDYKAEYLPRPVTADYLIPFEKEPTEYTLHPTANLYVPRE